MIKKPSDTNAHPMKNNHLKQGKREETTEKKNL